MRAAYRVYPLLALTALAAARPAARAGDSIFGTVREVREPTLVRLEVGRAQLLIRMDDVTVPEDSAIDWRARELVSALVGNRPARARIERENERGELVSRLLTADSAVGMNRDVAVALVEAGLALPALSSGRRLRNLNGALERARQQKVGVWAPR